MISPQAPDCIQNYQLKGVIGEGAFSVVRLAFRPDTGEYFACKIIQRSRLQMHNLDVRFEQEIRVSQQLHHPGVVQLFDLLQDENNYYVMMEFCQDGELFQYIVQRQRLEEKYAVVFIRQILEGLQYIHSMGVCHRDLKPENLLLDQYAHVKISDFGLSRYVGPGGLVSTPCGSPCYASPECISGHPYNGLTSDIWSVGVISYAMLTGQLPWTKRNQQQLFDQIRRGEYQIPGYLSDQCRNFLTGLMTVDISRRFSIDQALHHPWLFQGIYRSIEANPLPRSYPSLRYIDRFFNRELPETDLPSNYFYQMTDRECISFIEPITFSEDDEGLNVKKACDFIVKAIKCPSNKFSRPSIVIRPKLSVIPPLTKISH